MTVKLKRQRVRFLGKQYTRYPSSKSRGLRWYFSRYDHQTRKVYMLHRDIWEHYYGEIPKGYVVHHIDENPLNNKQENLQLLTRGAHSALHNKGKPKKPEATAKQAAGVKQWWLSVKKRTQVCVECGRTFKVRSMRRAYCCSQPCAQRRWLKSKIK